MLNAIVAVGLALSPVGASSPSGGPNYAEIAPTMDPNIPSCAATHNCVQVLPSVFVEDYRVHAVQEYIKGVALFTGQAVEIAGELVPNLPDVRTLLSIVDCEWRAGWHEVTTGNGFYGRGQWLLSTWRSLAVTFGYPYPSDAPIAVQLQAMRDNRDRSGGYRTQWPGCSRRLGLS